MSWASGVSSLAWKAEGCLHEIRVTPPFPKAESGVTYLGNVQQTQNQQGVGEIYFFLFPLKLKC